jgi:hypothetical protein
MPVSNLAQNYWSVSSVAKKTLYEFKNVFGLVVGPLIASKVLDGVPNLDFQKLVLAATPYQASVALMTIKTFYGETRVYGMTEKNARIELKFPRRQESKMVL